MLLGEGSATAPIPRERDPLFSSALCPSVSVMFPGSSGNVLLLQVSPSRCSCVLVWRQATSGGVVRAGVAESVILDAVSMHVDLRALNHGPPVPVFIV